jgi:hypothetical protein
MWTRPAFGSEISALQEDPSLKGFTPEDEKELTDSCLGKRHGIDLSQLALTDVAVWMGPFDLAGPYRGGNASHI